MNEKPTYEALEQRIQVLEKAALDNKRLQDAFRESEEKFRVLADSTPTTVMLYQDDRFIYANKAAEATIGYSVKELVGMNFWEFIHPDHKALIQERGRRRQQGQETQNRYELKFITKDGTERWADLAGASTTIGGRPAGIVTVTDITDRKRAERALKESEEKFAVSFLKSPIPMSITAMNDGRFIEVNEAFARVIGLSREEFLDNTSVGIGYITADQRERFLEEYRKKGCVENLELPIRVKGGELKYGLINASKITIGDEDFFLSMVTDITERKQVEEEARKSRRFLSDLIEHSGALICIKDAEGRYELVNGKWEEVTGLNRRKVMGRTDEELFPGPIGIQFHRNDIEVMETGSVLEKEEILEDEEHGKRFFISIKFPVRDDDGVIRGLCGMITEITARKKMEEALEISEKRLSRAEIISRSGHWAFDMKSKQVLSSEGARRIYGLPDRDWKIEEVQAIALPEYRSMLNQALRGLMEENRPYDVEFKIKRPDTGDVIDVRSVAEYDRHSRVVFGVIQDMTEYKRAESQRAEALDALRKSESVIHAITDAAQDAIVMMDPAGCISFWNPAAEKIFGYTNREALGKNLHQLLAPERYQEIHRVAFERFQATGQGDAIDRTIELMACRKNGEEFPIELSLSAVQQEDGRHALGVMRDITTRKAAEQALRDSEALYRTFINATSDLVFLKDEQLRNIVVNSALAAFFGRPEGEIIGKRDYELMPPAAAEKCEKTDLEALTCKSVVVSEEVIGDQVYETLKFPVDLGSNKIGVGGFIRDVTIRRQAEEELQESRRRLEDIIEFLPDATLVVDREGKVIAWNRAIENMTGVRKEDILGKGDYEYALPFYDERRPVLINYALDPDRKMEKRYTAIQRVGDVYFAEALAPHLPAGDTNLYATASVLHDSKGNIIGAIECIRDNTERKKLAERLNRAEKMEALGTLAGGVAHDLNNVLGVLVGYSEILRDELPEGSALRKYADNILQSSMRGTAIIQDLLTLARRGVTTSEVVNLNKVVSDYLRTPEFEKLKSYQPDVKFSAWLEGGLLNIKGSPIHLGKTIMNLVSNAAEAISGPGEVRIRTENRYLDKPIKGYDEMNEGDYVVLTVSDTGTGISPNDLSNIFEPFYTRKVMGRSGTGLGLAVVWGTVKDHNGYIDVQSEEGRGTIFNLYFPVTREEMVKAEKSVSPVAYAGRGEFILVVDDVKEQRDLAISMLGRLGYAVEAVASGEAAIEYLRNKKADLVVLDMIMEPGIDGMETYRRILEIHPGQKAVIVSGFSETDRVRKAQELGAGAFIRKPYILEKIGLGIRKELDRQ